MNEIAKLKAKLEEMKRSSTSAPKVEMTSTTGNIQSAVTLDTSRILERIKRLENNLTNKIPGWESLLHSIHRELSKDAELTHLLKPEDIGVIVKAMCAKKNIVLVDEKSKASKKVSLKNTTVDDL